MESEKISPEELVRKIDLPNRYKSGERCRKKVADVITELSYLCLPPIFAKVVDHTVVWAALQPRRPQSDRDVYLDALSDEVILFDTLSAWQQGDMTAGEVNHSKFDLCLAFASAGVAVSLALRRTDALQGATLQGNLNTFFGVDTRRAEAAVQGQQVLVHILTPYRVMVDILRQAVNTFLHANEYLRQTLSQDNFKFDTIDSSQGTTYDTVVLALPENLDEWTAFLGDVHRIITMLSRSFRTVALPRLHGRFTSKSFNDNTGQVLKGFTTGPREYKWWQFLGVAEKGVLTPGFWRQWLNAAHELLTMRRNDHAAAAVPEAPSRPTQDSDARGLLPETFRGCPLTFHRCLKVLVKREYCIRHWLQDTPIVQEQVVFASMKEEARRVFCQCIYEAWDSWFNTDIYPGCNDQWMAARNEEGALLSLLPSPVKTHQETRLYSAVVRGLGQSSWDEWPMGRMEWLCFQVITEARRNLSDAATLSRIATEFRVNEPPTLRICWTTHKIAHDEHSAESTAAGANDRADFFLIADDPGRRYPVILLQVYHTTNAVPHTFSANSRDGHAETRILARSAFQMCLEAMDRSVRELAKSSYGPICLHFHPDNGAPDPPDAPRLNASQSAPVLSEDEADPEEEAAVRDN